MYKVRTGCFCARVKMKSTHNVNLTNSSPFANKSLEIPWMGPIGTHRDPPSGALGHQLLKLSILFHEKKSLPFLRKTQMMLTPQMSSFKGPEEKLVNVLLAASCSCVNFHFVIEKWFISRFWNSQYRRIRKSDFLTY